MKSLLYRAALVSEDLVASLLLDGLSGNDESPTLGHPLIAAVSRGNVGSARLLLEHGACIADAQKSHLSNRNVLHMAAAGGPAASALAMVEALLPFCDSDALFEEDASYSTPLAIAAERKNLPLFQVLLQRMQRLQPKWDPMPVPLFGEEKHSARSALAHVEKERRLAVLDAVKPRERAAVFWVAAAEAGSVEMMQMLLDASRAAGGAQFIGPSCLAVAVQRGFVNVVRFLLRDDVPLLSFGVGEHSMIEASGYDQHGFSREEQIVAWPLQARFHFFEETYRQSVKLQPGDDAPAMLCLLEEMKRRNIAPQTDGVKARLAAL
jgi:hypothetical protein